MLAVINLLVWLKIIASLRIFKMTRAFIRLILETMKDMISFALVLIVAMITFIMSFIILAF